jgi:aspartyl-tRNA(Asn)/glutamyl-tRNA(Gln) amidotransferase subunit A
VAVLERLGATVSEVILPYYEETNAATMLTIGGEAFAYHRNDLQQRWGDFFAKTRQMVALGALASAADYVQAQRVRRFVQGQLAELFQSVDVIVNPTASAGAPSYEHLGEDGLATMLGTIHTAYWDGMGNPVLVVPMGFSGGGLPLSLQLAARPFEEGLLVRAGDAFQSVTDWHRRVPPLVAAGTVGG